MTIGNTDIFAKRKSIRNFKPDKVKHDDLIKIIEAATLAPSGKNKQNWHFIVIENKEKIETIAKIIEKKHDEICKKITDEIILNKFKNFINFLTFFKNAPCLFLVYAKDYVPTGRDILMHIDGSEEEIYKLNLPNPGIQAIGAAVENMLLKASDLGYGTCWMTGPNFSNKEIEEYINFEDKDYYLTCMFPIGIPLSTDRPRPKRKKISEISTFIK